MPAIGATIEHEIVTPHLVRSRWRLWPRPYARSSSVSAFVGLDANVSYGASGFSASCGINVSASNSGSESQTISVSHAQTTVSGSNWVTLTSGRDTNLYGAEVSGGGIAAQVARNLTIVSDQDTERQTAPSAITSWSSASSRITATHIISICLMLSSFEALSSA